MRTSQELRLASVVFFTGSVVAPNDPRLPWVFLTVLSLLTALGSMYYIRREELQRIKIKAELEELKSRTTRMREQR